MGSTTYRPGCPLCLLISGKFNGMTIWLVELLVARGVNVGRNRVLIDCNQQLMRSMIASVKDLGSRSEVDAGRSLQQIGQMCIQRSHFSIAKRSLRIDSGIGRYVGVAGCARALRWNSIPSSTPSWLDRCKSTLVRISNVFQS